MKHYHAEFSTVEPNLSTIITHFKSNEKPFIYLFEQQPILKITKEEFDSAKSWFTEIAETKIQSTRLLYVKNGMREYYEFSGPTEHILYKMVLQTDTLITDKCTIIQLQTKKPFAMPYLVLFEFDDEDNIWKLAL